MTVPFQPERLDVAAFAQSKASLSERDPLSIYERLAQEAIGPTPDITVGWSVHGEQRSAVDGVVRPALHLRARAVLLRNLQGSSAFRYGSMPSHTESEERP